jgi:hypothetical protein
MLSYWEEISFPLLNTKLFFKDGELTAELPGIHHPEDHYLLVTHLQDRFEVQTQMDKCYQLSLHNFYTIADWLSPSTICWI